MTLHPACAPIHGWAHAEIAFSMFLGINGRRNVTSTEFKVSEFWHHDEGDHHRPLFYSSNMSSFCLVLVVGQAGVIDGIADAIPRFAAAV